MWIGGCLENRTGGVKVDWGSGGLQRNEGRVASCLWVKTGKKERGQHFLRKRVCVSVCEWML